LGQRSSYFLNCDTEATEFRKQHGFDQTQPVEPFEVAKGLGINVIEANKLKGMNSKDLKLLKALEADWSGLSFRSPKGLVVVLNPFHSQARRNMTLMEEICHSIHGHKPKVKISPLGPTEIDFLQYSEKDEKDAYAIGAAILVPFEMLHKMILEQRTAEAIAKHFFVSADLIKYRMKVTKVWRLYNAVQQP
jgi:Zn-dependent peptidase ImmA (M78 family)